MKSNKKAIVLMGYSPIREDFAEVTAHGTFATVAEAETAGKQKFKSIDWLVAERITRVPARGPNEVTYNYATEIQKPRRRTEA